MLIGNKKVGKGEVLCPAEKIHGFVKDSELRQVLQFYMPYATRHTHNMGIVSRKVALRHGMLTRAY